jgi:hypothetical protein
MSVAVMLQAWGWVSVVWLVTVHLLIRRGRLPQHGLAYQVAGSVAAVSVVAASAAEDLWPVAVLGLLWLRVEVFGHRHPAQRPAERVPAPMPEFLVGALERSGRHTSSHAPEAGHPEHPHHLPHPHIGPRAVDVLFKIEMAVVIGIASVLFLIWAQEQRHTVGRDANTTLCHWMRQC